MKGGHPGGVSLRRDPKGLQLGSPSGTCEAVPCAELSAKQTDARPQAGVQGAQPGEARRLVLRRGHPPGDS